jgi:hypothetical protein
VKGEEGRERLQEGYLTGCPGRRPMKGRRGKRSQVFPWRG